MRPALPPLWRLLLLLWPLWGAAALGRLAVIRPFAASDAAGLVASFAQWNTHLPCSATLSVPVELILCFSQNLSADAEAAAATQAIVAEFHSRLQRGTEWAWPLCFRQVRAVSAFITPEDDIYLPDDVTGNPDWVKGPNLQFLAMAEAMEDGSWGEFDAWFMMEMDCKTQRTGWLEELVQEVQGRAPFAVLGSFYRGDQWDAFPVPPAVRHHINGNAVYNRSSPFTHLLVSTLKAAMANGPVLQAFDVFGAEVYLNSTLEADQLGWYAGDSQVIGNYAHTPMLETYFAGEALVHGGWLYAEWNSTEEPLTLVVSDFGRWDPDEPSWTELETFEAALARGHHPFRHVVVLRPAENATATPYVQSTVGDSVEQIWYREVARNDTVWFDWCHAPVNTTWFLHTNVFFDFRHRVDIRQTPGNGSVPVASYVPSGSHYCQDSEPCVFSMRRAKNFTGTEPTGHVDLSQLLINTAQRDAFCAAWRTWYTARPAPDCDPIPGPTADEYAAFLLSTGATGLYAWEDILKRGQRSFGVQRTFPSDLRPCAFPSQPTNATLCEVITEELTCASTAGCAWRPHFEVCFNGSRVEVPQAPTLSVSYRSPEGCGFNYTSPIVVIRNAEPHHRDWLNMTKEMSCWTPPAGCARWLPTARRSSRPNSCFKGGAIGREKGWTTLGARFVLRLWGHIIPLLFHKRLFASKRLKAPFSSQGYGQLQLFTAVH